MLGQWDSPLPSKGGGLHRHPRAGLICEGARAMQGVLTGAAVPRQVSITWGGWSVLQLSGAWNTQTLWLTPGDLPVQAVTVQDYALRCGSTRALPRHAEIQATLPPSQHETELFA